MGCLLIGVAVRDTAWQVRDKRQKPLAIHVSEADSLRHSRDRRALYISDSPVPCRVPPHVFEGISQENLLLALSMVPKKVNKTSMFCCKYAPGAKI